MTPSTTPPFQDAPTNVWALDKSPALKAILVALRAQLGEDAFAIEERTPTAREGIWLCHHHTAGVRAYVFVHGQEEGRAGVHLEYPKQPGSPPPFEHSEHVSAHGLAEILAAHFDVAVVSPGPYAP